MHEPRKPRPALAAGAVAALVLLASAVSTVAPAAADDTPSSTELRASFERAAAKPGKVLHSVTELRSATASSSAETWLDLPHRRVRQQITSSDGEVRGTVVDGEQVARWAGGSIRPSSAPCGLESLAANLTHVCGDTTADGAKAIVRHDARVEAATRGGRAAWKLTEHTSITPGRTTMRITSVTWFERRTSLPIASTSTSTMINDGQRQRHTATVEERSRFVDGSSLPPDFFTADALATWAATQPTATTSPHGTFDTTSGFALHRGTSSDGAQWILYETDVSQGCLSLQITGGAASGGGGTCSAPPNGTWVNTFVNSLAGHPTFLVAVAPKGTKTLKVVARHGKHGADVEIFASDPIRMSNGATAFVVELPDGARTIRSTRIAR